LNVIRRNEENLLQQLVKSEECLEQLRYNSEYNKQDLSFLNENTTGKASGFHNKDKCNESSRCLRSRDIKEAQKLSYSCLGSNSDPNLKCKYSKCSKGIIKIRAKCFN